MKKLLGGIAISALLTAPALSADLRMPVKAPPAPVVAAYNWSGFYIGAHAGGGWSERCFTDIVLGADGCHDADGWLAGGQVGFNWQTGQFVFGVEFSGSWTDINGSHVSLLDPTATHHSDINSILMLTGRVGLAFDRALLYVTGGGAWVRDEFRFSSPVGTASIDQSRTGWTIGAGIEYGFAPNWSIAAQYNFVDLGDRDLTFGAPFVPFTVSVERELHIATVRLNYRFGGLGGPVVARY